MPDLQTLNARVDGYVIDLPTLTDALIDSWINKAIKDASRRYNWRPMEATQEENTTASTRLLATKAADWKEMRADPWLEDADGASWPIAWASSHDEMVRLFDEQDTTDDGEPKFILENELDFHVYPFPDGESDWSGGEYRVRLPYWKYLSDLVNPTDDNWFTNNMEWYVTFYATAEALMHNREEQRAAVYFERAEKQFLEQRRADKRSRLARRVTLGVHRDVHATRMQRRL